MLSYSWRVRDLVHGTITFTEEEQRIIESPLFVRLRLVKQNDLTATIYRECSNNRRCQWDAHRRSSSQPKRIRTCSSMGNGTRFSKDTKELGRLFSSAKDGRSVIRTRTGSMSVTNGRMPSKVLRGYFLGIGSRKTSRSKIPSKRGCRGGPGFLQKIAQ